MNKKSLLLSCAAAVLSAALPLGTAHADPVTYSFAGSVLDDEAERGWSTFSGSFSFDSQAADLIADASTAAYAHAGASWGASVSFDGGSSFSIDHGFHVLVSNDLGGEDQFGVLAQSADGLSNLQLTLWDLDGSVFGSDALPLPAGGLSLADFDWSEFVFDGPSGRLQGRLDSLVCAAGCSGIVVPPPAVPEPGSLSLMLAALSALGFLQGRRARMLRD